MFLVDVRLKNFSPSIELVGRLDCTRLSDTTSLTRVHALTSQSNLLETELKAMQDDEDVLVLAARRIDGGFKILYFSEFAL